MDRCASNSWGEQWHHGTPYGSVRSACGYTPPGLHPGDPPATTWVCAGLQVKFDREVELRSTFGMLNSMASGFELLNNVAGTEAASKTTDSERFPPPECAPGRTAGFRRHPGLASFKRLISADMRSMHPPFLNRLRSAPSFTQPATLHARCCCGQTAARAHARNRWR